MARDAWRVQRVGDPVICTFACDDCIPCKPGVVQTGLPNFFVEGKNVAVTGSVCSNCCDRCACCPCPNFVLSGYYFNLFAFGKGLARKIDRVSNGYFSGGAVRTYVGGISR